MNFVIKKQHTNGYNTIADGDDDTDTSNVLPRVTAFRSTLTTVRSWSGVVVIVVAGMMMLVAGSAVWMQDGGSSYTTTAKGLVVGTQGNIPCLPATGTFNGISFWSNWSDGYPFETCYQHGYDQFYCWSKSYYRDHPPFGSGYFECSPKPKGEWHVIDAADVIPKKRFPPTCGPP